MLATNFKQDIIDLVTNLTPDILMFERKKTYAKYSVNYKYMC